MSGVVLSPSQPQTFNPPVEYLKAGGYSLLGVITALAIWAISVSIFFIGAGHLLAQYYGPGGDLSVMIQWFSSSFYTSIIGGTLSSIYFIVKTTGPIFKIAQEHWNNAKSGLI